MKRFKVGQYAFTMFEIIVTLAIVAILAAFAATRYLDDSPTLDGQTAQLANDIRLTRSLSMSRNERFRVNFSADRYTITDRTNTTPYSHPITGTSPLLLVGGITLVSSVPFVVFDGLGTPYDSASLSASPLTTDVTIVLTSPDGATKTVTIIAETGKVTVS